VFVDIPPDPEEGEEVVSVKNPSKPHEFVIKRHPVNGEAPFYRSLASRLLVSHKSIFSCQNLLSISAPVILEPSARRWRDGCKYPVTAPMVPVNTWTITVHFQPQFTADRGSGGSRWKFKIIALQASESSAKECTGFPTGTFRIRSVGTSHYWTPTRWQTHLDGNTISLWTLDNSYPAQVRRWFSIWFDRE